MREERERELKAAQADLQGREIFFLNASLALSWNGVKPLTALWTRLKVHTGPL